ncbi:MAG TPA: Maf family protein [Candidatus Saccharimonadales bacterium]|nr:Maf family protein [Candidatus Saccharimonadales bacterium]
MHPNVRLILGSQSPRRKDLLDKMGLADRYEIIPSEFDEHLDEARSPGEVAEELGYGKALWVAERNPGAWVIGSDTIVTVDGKQLAKPVDVNEARAMLKMLAGHRHTVTTSVALVCVEPTVKSENIIKHFIGHEEVSVYFKPYNDKLVEAYLASGDWHDKAGGYGIQSGAQVLVDHIEGNYDTIVGLPTHLLAEFLNKIGIPSKPAAPKAAAN